MSFRWFEWDTEARPHSDVARAEYSNVVGRDYEDTDDQKRSEDAMCRALLGGALREIMR